MHDKEGLVFQDPQFWGLCQVLVVACGLNCPLAGGILSRYFWIAFRRPRC